MNKLFLPIICCFMIWSCSQQSEASAGVAETVVQEEMDLSFYYNWVYQNDGSLEQQKIQSDLQNETNEEKTKSNIEQNLSESSVELADPNIEILLKQYLPNKIQDLIDWADLYKDETQILDLRLLALDEMMPYIHKGNEDEQEQILNGLLEIQKYNIRSLQISEFKEIDFNIYLGKILISCYEQNNTIYFSLTGQESEMGKIWDLKITEVSSSN